MVNLDFSYLSTIFLDFIISFGGFHRNFASLSDFYANFLQVCLQLFIFILCFDITAVKSDGWQLSL